MSLCVYIDIFKNIGSIISDINTSHNKCFVKQTDVSDPNRKIFLSEKNDLFLKDP